MKHRLLRLFCHRITRLSLALVLLTFLAVKFDHQGGLLNRRVEAIGNLLITYPGSPGDPIFNVSGMLPGDCEIASVHVDNSGQNQARVAVKSRNEFDQGNLKTQLSFRVSEAGVDIYGGVSPTGSKSVADFFTDSTALNGVELSTVASGTATDYLFEVCFNPAAGNQYQNTSTIFDLVFGQIQVPVELPAECKALEGIVTVKIEGTDGDDKIDGTSASEYIVGKGGRDKIKGGGGDDCIFAGEGDDNVNSGSGSDIIVGGPGNDDLDGHADNDIIYGNEGDDTLHGKDGQDLIYAGIGNDTVKAGGMNDVVYGGDGNDNLNGESGNDHLYGEAGDDTLSGSSGDDYLDGGPDTDFLNGSSGTDTCISGETTGQCELF